MQGTIAIKRPRIRIPLLSRTTRKANPPVMVDLFLWGKAPLRIQIPLSEPRKYLGVAGCHLRQPPPFRQMFGMGLGAFFAAFLGFYAWIFYQAVGPIVLWGLIGAAMGSVGGWLLGVVLTHSTMKIVYVAWSSWDAEKQQRTIVPIEHTGAAIRMMPKHRRAFLTAIGEAPPAAKQQPLFEGEKRAAVTDEEDPLTAHIVATYSTKGLYNSLQAKVQRRILSGHRGAEKLLQYASIGSIAVAMLIIAALVTMTMAGGNDSASPAKSAPAPGIEASNAKR